MATPLPTYAELFEVIKAKQYANGIAPVLAISKLNEDVQWRAFPIKGSETNNGGIQVALQRLKRLKSDVSVQDATKGAGENFVNRLNKAVSADWKTVTTITVNKRDFLIKFSKFQDMDISVEKNVKTYQWLITQGLKGDITYYEQEAEKRLVAGDPTVSKPKLVYTGTLAEAQEVVKTIMTTVKGLQLFVDDFKAYLDAMDIAVLIHPMISHAFSIVQGQSYETGTNTFPKGLGKAFKYDGIDFFEAPLLNSIEGAAATEVIGAVIFDKGAYADGGFELNFKAFAPQVYLDENVAGHSYGQLSAIIDPLRIKVLEYTIPAGITKSKGVME